MKKYAFLYHPWDVPILYKMGIKEDSIEKKDLQFVEKTMEWLKPIRRTTEVIKSIQGNEVECEMIMVPLTAEQILTLNPQIVLDKTIQAAQLACDLGVDLIGLGAYLSPVGRRGVLISKAVNKPVTSGTTYTISTGIQATIKAAQTIGVEIEKAKITIIGATGSIGKTCAKYLMGKVGQLVLSARNMERLNILKEELEQISSNTKVECNAVPRDAVKNSDIVVISTSCPSTILNISDFTEGCVVCDISVPHNISPDDANKKDVLVVDGGIVQFPCPVDFNYLALPKGVGYACLSEATILALEGRFESFSCGGEISSEKISEINKLADKHGFKLANFKSFGQVVDDATIERIIKARKNRK